MLSAQLGRAVILNCAFRELIWLLKQKQYFMDCWTVWEES